MRLGQNRRYVLMLPYGLILALGSSCLHGCFPTSDYYLRLGNGYSLARWSYKTVALCNAEMVAVVMPHIDRYQVYPAAIIGHVVKHHDPYYRSVPGYFVVDMKTGKVYQGLSYEEWLKLLRTYGIRSAPAMQRTRE